jgi:type I restriction enzyme R subunit
MTPDISERAFEDAIERALLRRGPDAYPDDPSGVQAPVAEFGDDPLPGSFHKRQQTDYDRGLCLIASDVLDFLLATQPKEWVKLKQHYGADVKPRFLGRLSREIARRGALDVLRNGVRDSGCKFRLAYFRPASGLNEELQRLHAANLFAVIRQLHFSEKSEQSIDLALFLNGIPIFTAELKNPLTGQDVRDAVHQYKVDRDPREPIFAYARCLAHFAVDPDQVFVTTQLLGVKTRFLPFNRGRFGGAGTVSYTPSPSPRDS